VLSTFQPSYPRTLLPSYLTEGAYQSVGL
jgi:hypothetical protein